MKAVIVECKNGQAAILDREGIVRIIPDRGYTVGEILNVNSALIRSQGTEKGRHVGTTARRMRKHTLLVAACMSLAVFAGGISAVAMPVSTVTVDSEPSVGYGLNIFGSVVQVSAYNDKAEELAGDLSRYVKGKPIDKAVQITLDVFSEKGYLAQDGLSVAVSVETAPARQESVENEVNAGLERWKESRLTEEEAGSFVTETVLVSPQLREEARQEGVTPGRIVMERYAPEPSEQEPMSDAPEKSAQTEQGAQNRPAAPPAGREGNPGANTEAPALNTEGPVMNSEAPTMNGEAPMTNSEAPGTNTDASMMNQEAPAVNQEGAGQSGQSGMPDQMPAAEPAGQTIPVFEQGGVPVVGDTVAEAQVPSPESAPSESDAQGVPAGRSEVQEMPGQAYFTLSYALRS